MLYPNARLSCWLLQNIIKETFPLNDSTERSEKWEGKLFNIFYPNYFYSKRWASFISEVCNFRKRQWMIFLLVTMKHEGNSFLMSWRNYLTLNWIFKLLHFLVLEEGSWNEGSFSFTKNMKLSKIVLQRLFYFSIFLDQILFQ